MPDPVATTPYLTNTDAGPTRPAVGPVALVPDAATDPDAELTHLLRRRLRQAALLFLAGYTAFLARDLLARDGPGGDFQLAALGLAVAAQLALAAVIWSGWPRTLGRVHVVEAGCLAVAGGLLASTQYAHLTSWPDVAPLLGSAGARDGQVLLANTWILPWFCLITGFPVVVPNPVRRTLVACGLLALVPPAVTLAALAASPELRAARPGLMFVQYAIWGGLAVGIAAYGAGRAERLRVAAREAKRFGQYRLTRKLGGGGMGEVFLAEHLLLKRPDRRAHV